MRIFPLYLATLAIYALVIPISTRDLWFNIALFPLNYAQSGIQVLISPAWSLACEAHFYLLVPLIVLASSGTLRVLAGLSLGLFVISPVFPNDSFWAYVALPGILFTFITGVLINRGEWRFLGNIYACLGVLLPLFVLAKVSPWHLKTGIHINVCLGYVCAAPLTRFLARRSPGVKWDRILGLFSFPLFLIHSLVRVLGEAHFFHLGTFSYIGLSLLASALLILLIEKPFDHVRYQVRGLFRSKARSAVS